MSEQLSLALRVILVEAFVEDVRILSRIFGRDLSYWLEPAVASGRAGPVRAVIKVVA